MGLSMSLEKIAELIMNKRKLEKKQIADYLDSIAEEAQKLAEIWSENRDAVEVKHRLGRGQNRTRQKADSQKVGHTYLRQISNGSRFCGVKEYYSQMSNAVGGRISEDFHALFVERLANLIQTRGQVILMFEKISPKLNGDGICSHDDIEEAVEHFGEATENLIRQAAKLRVLAKTYRASL